MPGGLWGAKEKGLWMAIPENFNHPSITLLMAEKWDWLSLLIWGCCNPQISAYLGHEGP